MVDEMQTMPGVDYESMLSELGKFGANFILATQSLAKLEDLSRTMRDTVLATVGCLAAFQMAGTDARQLVWELGKERVSEDDVTSLDVHQCYVQATVGAQRMDALHAGAPAGAGEPGGGPAVARRIRDLALGYLTAPEDIGPQDDEMRKLVEKYRAELEQLRQGPGCRRENQASPPAQPKPTNRRNQRSRRQGQPAPGPDRFTFSTFRRNAAGAARARARSLHVQHVPPQCGRGSPRPGPMREWSRAMTRSQATLNRTARGRPGNEAPRRHWNRAASPAGPDALPGPAGTGRPDRAVPGRGL